MFRRDSVCVFAAASPPLPPLHFDFAIFDYVMMRRR